MKFTAAAVLAAATGAAAMGSNVTYVTEVVDAYTTYCPYATQITHGSHTYTVTEATTLTITDCPCTITRPVTSTAIVSCPPTGIPPPSNATWTTAVAPPTGGAPPPPTGGAPPPPTGGAPPPPTSTPTGGMPSSAGKVAALSGGALAGVIGLAAFIL